MKSFKELGLSESFLRTLENCGFIQPSEIQEKTIPFVLEGKDVIGGSATGSGKTLAFSAPIIEKLESNGKIQALILTPTRELAEQITDSIRKFSAHRRLKVVSVYGGVNIETQKKNLFRADVVVGTPGRILDHLQRKSIDFRNVKFLVLDEVDRMLDMGFHYDVDKIISQCPKQRQTMLFSATISADLDHLSKKYTKNPSEVSIASHVDATKLKQVYYDVDDKLKFSLLVHLLKKEKSDLVMVFCGTRNNVDFVASNLILNGINSKAIHGGMEQGKRIKVLSDFHSKGVQVLVCTDVAARGLDIKGVSHVYNYDLPKTSAEYIHRIGRTARAGENGIAISILGSRDYENFRNVLRDEKISITALSVPKFERAKMKIPERNVSRRNPKGNYSQRDSSPRRDSNSRRSSERVSPSRRGSGLVARPFGRNSRDRNSRSQSVNRDSRQGNRKPRQSRTRTAGQNSRRNTRQSRRY